ncbi:MAG: ABC transporter permease [Defluviitaleaceae bacterium]|nr:ABC transporter permease [Defluviitaleaceae bacterium]
MKSSSIILTSLSLQMKQTFVRPMFKYTMIVGPLLYTIILGEIFRNASAESFVAYVVLGSGLLNLWNSIAFSSAGDINRERFSNTLSIIFTAPADFRLILLGKIIGNTILSLGAFFLSVFFAIALYRPEIAVQNWLLLAISLLLALVAFIVVSIFIAYLLTLSKKTELWMNCLTYPFAIIFGFLFPIENLPQAAQYFSWVFPPTWAVRLMRYSVTDTAYSFTNALIPLLITTVIFTLLAGLLYKAIFKQAKVSGTLDMA